MPLQNANVRRWFRSWLVVLAVASGCAPANVGRVAGKVTLDGQPVQEGTVVFQDLARGLSVNADLQADGTYVVRTYNLAGLPPGSYHVAVTPRKFGSGEVPLVQAPGAPPPTVIPPKYQDAATSGLTAAIKAGRNPPFDFALQR
jgi:hypothetical protein